MSNLADAKSKLEWARKMMPELKSALANFFDAKPCEFFNEPCTDKSKTYVKLRLAKAIPSEFSHLVGDIIHNLRASLDYAACDLAELNGAKNVDDVYFPFGKTQESFEASAKNKLKKLSGKAKAYIHDIRPYRGGNEALWLVHYLDIGDKHRRLTPIGMTGSTGAHIELMTSGGISFAAPKWESLAVGMRVATIEANTEWNGKITAQVTVAFGNVQSIAHTPVEPLLEQLVRECEATVASIASTLFPPN